MTAILFYANYDNNSMLIIRIYFICQVTNLAYANTFVANLNQNVWSETDVVNYISHFTIQMAAILFMNGPLYKIIHMWIKKAMIKSDY